MHRPSPLPAARPAAEFLIEELPGEVLVYDQKQHRAHCLTPELRTLWQLCDGRRTAAQATAQLRQVHGEAVGEIGAMVAELEKAGLVLAPASKARRRVDRGRRRFVGKTAVAAGIVIASPVIFSIVSPSVAEAASCGTKGLQCCPPPTKCVNGNKFCNGGVCTG
jgi:hypothetical protein